MRSRNNHTLVSIIVPVFNEEKNINKCLNSIIKQNYKPIELIVINDGSTDNSEKIITSKNYKIKYYYTSHLGAGNAKNIGAKLASGYVLVFIDADMFLDKNYIKRITKPIFEGKTDKTFSKTEYIANITNQISRCWNINNDIFDNKRINDKNANDGQVVRAIRKDIFVINGAFNTAKGYYDDQLFMNKEEYAFEVKDAIAYHNNPDTLLDVYFSARWIGRSPVFNKTLKNIISYSIINSIRISINKIFKGAPLVFILFKIIFDYGILSGIIFKNMNKLYSK